MRLFEAGFCAALILAAATAFSGRSWLSLAACWLSVVLLLLHVTTEGARIQGIAGYVGLAVLLIAVYGMPPGVFRAGFLVLALACATAALAAFYFYPILKLPQPGGPYAIGTNTFYLTDHARREHYLAGGGESRRVVAQVWYPAQTCDGATAPYRSPRDLISHFQRSRYVKTHACRDAPFVSPLRQWPLVLYSPSFGGYRSQTTYITEYLASHGYVVVGVDHPGTGARIGFPDGFVAVGMPDAWMNLASPAAYERSKIKAEDVLDTNVKDLQFVLGQLLTGTSDPRLAALKRQIDATRIAAVGYSYGGAAAAELCRRDERIRTGINLDGWMFRNVYSQGIPKPFLFLIEDDPLWFQNEGPYGDNADGAIRLGTKEYHAGIRHSLELWGGCVGRMVHANHTDFADTATELRRWPWQPRLPLRPELIHDAIRKIFLAFLDEKLLGKRGAVSQISKQVAKYCDLKCVDRRADIAAALGADPQPM